MNFNWLLKIIGIHTYEMNWDENQLEDTSIGLWDTNNVYYLFCNFYDVQLSAMNTKQSIWFFSMLINFLAYHTIFTYSPFNSISTLYVSLTALHQLYLFTYLLLNIIIIIILFFISSHCLPSFYLIWAWAALQ